MKVIVHLALFAQLLHASHRYAYQSCQATNLRVGEGAMPRDWLDKLVFAYGADVVRLGRAVFPKACLS
jgi:hypothetical protein